MRRGVLALAGLACALLAVPVRAEEPAPEDVEVTTADGMSLAATYYPPKGRPAKGAPSVVALHMFNNSRASYARIAPAITAKGMGLLAIDMRGHGDSRVQDGKDLSLAVRGRDLDVFMAMHHDAWGGVRWLQRHKQVPKGRIALLGASVGCSVAIDTAVRHPSEIACVVTLTPGLSYLGIPTQDHIREWAAGKPLLVLASEGEKKRGAGPIHAALKDKGCEIFVMPGGRELHGTHMFGKVKGVETRVADWLYAKTDGVKRDDAIEPFERHGRHVEVIGKRIECVVGPSGDRLYVGVQPHPDSAAGSNAKVSLRVLGPKSRVLKSVPLVGHESPTATTKVKWLGHEHLYGAVELGVTSGKPFRVLVAIDGKTPAQSKPITVVLP